MQPLRLLRELAGYGTATGVAFVIDVGLLALQVSVLGMPYLVAVAVSFVAGTAFMYWISTRYVFAFRRVDDASLEFGVFLGIGVAGLLVNLIVIYIAVETLHLHYLVGKIGAGTLTFGLNYALRRLLLFTPRATRESSDRSSPG